MLEDVGRYVPESKRSLIPAWRLRTPGNHDENYDNPTTLNIPHAPTLLYFIMMQYLISIDTSSFYLTQFNSNYN